MKKVVALLPIKYHSERVSGKNFRNLCGQPLYRWILDTLLSCGQVDEVVVDTDSESFIDELAKQYPAVKTLLRPQTIRGGMVSMNRVIQYDMSQISKAEHFLQTHTTNPLLTRESIESAIRTYFKNLESYDSLFSVNRIQARTYRPDGSAINHILGDLKRTQDLDPILEENSNLFLFSRASFANTGSRIGRTPFLFETQKAESFEIDEEEDFVLVQTLLQARLDSQ